MEHLIAVLAERISNWYGQQAAESGAGERARRAAAPAGTTVAPVLGADPRAIAEALVRQAVENGLELGRANLQSEPMNEGSTAEVVERISLGLRFVFKLQKSGKLIDEARVIQSIRDNRRLPALFRGGFPAVYAVKDDGEPYAYLMEEFSKMDGYRSLAQALFKSPLCNEALGAESRRLIGGVLDILFGGYAASTDDKRMPNIDSVYLGRIEERLEAAARKDTSFRSTPIVVNGAGYDPWKLYLTRIRALGERLRALQQGFTCVVHGDAHPENILLRYDRHCVHYRFIDPKDWGEGDYLFDITKLAHYLDVAGPLEQVPDNQPEVTCEPGLERVSVSYDLQRPAWIPPAMELLLTRVAEFANGREDPEKMRLRFELGMASNLLGVPVGRLCKNRDAALVFYGEGMKWLDLFCRHLEGRAI
jgi:hypothetical protein